MGVTETVDQILGAYTLDADELPFRRAELEAHYARDNGLDVVRGDTGKRAEEDW